MMINDRQAALGIGAMLVFIAMILLAVISGAIIIGLTELISQQTQQTSADANTDTSRKIIVNNIWVGDNFDDYLIMFTFHPTGSAVSPTDVHIQLYCTTSAGVFMYFSTPLVDAVGGGANPGPYGYGGLDVWEISEDLDAIPSPGNAATLEPGRSYFVRLDGDNNNAVTSDCDPQYLEENGIAGNLWFHIEGGHSTHEVFYVYDRTHGTQIL
jgi:archaellin